MPKKWEEVRRSDAFKRLSSEEQEEARNQYFRDVVAPQVATEDLEAVRNKFDEDTAPSLSRAVKDYAGDAWDAINKRIRQEQPERDRARLGILEDEARAPDNSISDLTNLRTDINNVRARLGMKPAEQEQRGASGSWGDPVPSAPAPLAGVTKAPSVAMNDPLKTEGLEVLGSIVGQGVTRPPVPTNTLDRLNNTTEQQKRIKAAGDAAARKMVPGMVSPGKERDYLKLNKDSKGLSAIKQAEDAERKRIAKEIESYGQNFDENVAKGQYKPMDDRTTGETTMDMMKATAEGFAATGKMIGDVYGLSTGDMDNWLSKAGDEAVDYWRKSMSDYQQAMDASNQAQLAQVEKDQGMWAGFKQGVQQAIDDPLIAVARQLPNFIVGGVAGGAVKAAAAKALQTATAATLAEIGAGGNVLAMAAMQGADVGSDAYQKIIGQPQDQWDMNWDYQELVQSGEKPEVAKQIVALAHARVAAAKAGAVSVASNYMIPGGMTIEKILAGAMGKGGFTGVIGGLVKGYVGEAGQEAVEEGAGRKLVNEAVQNIDENQGAYEGVGGAAGVGAGTAGIIGGAAGTAGGVRDWIAKRGVTVEEQGQPVPPQDTAFDAGALFGADPAEAADKADQAAQAIAAAAQAGEVAPDADAQAIQAIEAAKADPKPDKIEVAAQAIAAASEQQPAPAGPEVSLPPAAQGITTQQPAAAPQVQAPPPPPAGPMVRAAEIAAQQGVTGAAPGIDQAVDGSLLLGEEEQEDVGTDNTPAGVVEPAVPGGTDNVPGGAGPADVGAGGVLLGGGDTGAAAAPVAGDGQVLPVPDAGQPDEALDQKSPVATEQDEENIKEAIDLLLSVDLPIMKDRAAELKKNLDQWKAGKRSKWASEFDTAGVLADIKEYVSTFKKAPPGPAWDPQAQEHEVQPPMPGQVVTWDTEDGPARGRVSDDQKQALGSGTVVEIIDHPDKEGNPKHKRVIVPTESLTPDEEAAKARDDLDAALGELGGILGTEADRVETPKAETEAPKAETEAPKEEMPRIATDDRAPDYTPETHAQVIEKHPESGAIGPQEGFEPDNADRMEGASVDEINDRIQEVEQELEEDARAYDEIREQGTKALTEYELGMREPDEAVDFALTHRENYITQAKSMLDYLRGLKAQMEGNDTPATRMDSWQYVPADPAVIEKVAEKLDLEIPKAEQAGRPVTITHGNTSIIFENNGKGYEPTRAVLFDGTPLIRGEMATRSHVIDAIKAYADINVAIADDWLKHLQRYEGYAKKAGALKKFNEGVAYLTDISKGKEIPNLNRINQIANSMRGLPGMSDAVDAMKAAAGVFGNAKAKAKAEPQPTAQIYEDASRNRVIRLIKESGGITMDEASDIIGETGRRAAQRMPGLFRNNGNGIDRIAEMFHEYGYLTDAEFNDVDGGVQRVREILRSALDKTGFVGTMAEQERHAQLQAMEQEIGDKHGEAIADEAMVLTDAIEEEYDNIPFTPAEIEAAGGNANPFGDDNGQTGNRPAVQEAAQGRANQGVANGTDQAQPQEGFGLEGYDKQDIAEKDARANDQAAADRAMADRERDAFNLTGQTAQRETPPTAEMFTPDGRATDAAAKARALEDLNDALADLGDIFGKNTRLYMITPEQEQKLLPVLTRVMDAAFRAGYYTFKEAAKFVLDQIRAKLGNNVADMISLDHLQGAYIGMAGKYGDKASSKKDVVSVENIADLDKADQPAAVPSKATETVPPQVTEIPARVKGAPLYMEPLGEKAVLILGDTMANKDRIKAAGAIWNRAHKGWMFPKANLAKMLDKLGDLFKPDEKTLAVEKAMEVMRHFMPNSQYRTIEWGMKGEEGEFFKDKMIEMAKVIEDMPKTYQQDGKGEGAVAHLHYFRGSTDFWITEKDKDGPGTEQAYGLASLYNDPNDGDMGYISIDEITASNVELDLYWTPKTIAEIKGKAAPAKTETKPEPTPAPAQEDTDTVKVAKEFAKRFQAGERFDSIVDARKVAGEILGKAVTPGTAIAKQVDEAIELGVVMEARRIAQAGNDAKATYDALVDLYDRQPNLSMKSSTSVANQAYSTPAPLAYLASRLAGIDKGTTVLEPTAGNGMLLIEAAPAKTVANELNDDRAENLRAIGFNPTTKNAATEKMAAEVPVQAVIMNPPFGTTKDAAGTTIEYTVPHIKSADGTYKTNEVDHAIAMKNLKHMRENGRAVLILGGVKAENEAARSDAYNSGAKRKFYWGLYGEYNVVDHFTVNGDLYSKQGAAWPVDVVVIEGRGKSARALPAVDVPRIYNSWEDLKGVLDEQTSRRDRNQAGATPAQGEKPASDNGVSGKPAGGIGDRPVSGNQDGEPGQVRVGSEQHPVGKPGGVGQSGQSGRVRDGGGSAGGNPAVEAFEDSGRDSVVLNEGTQFAKTVQVGEAWWVRFHTTGTKGKRINKDGKYVYTTVPDNGEYQEPGIKVLAIGKGNNPNFLVSEGGVGKENVPTVVPASDMMKMSSTKEEQAEHEKIVAENAAARAAEEDANRKPAERKTEKASEGQVNYDPVSKQGNIGTLVPANMREAVKSALENLQDRVGDLDAFVAEHLDYKKEDLGSYFSAEQVDALALALDNLDNGKGFIIGDQTGVGKGRVNAAIMKWAIKNGKTPIFVTEKPNLYRDMLRDMADIGMAGKSLEQAEDGEKMRGVSKLVLMTNADQDIPIDAEAMEWFEEMEQAKEEGLPPPPKPKEGFMQKVSGPKQKERLDRMAQNGRLEDGAKVVFTTYSQIQTVKGNTTVRNKFLDTFAKGGILILDESHNAGGSSNDRGAKNDLNRAVLVRQLAGAADGVFYSSATYAKNPAVMDLYFRTDMSMAVSNMSELKGIIENGGVPMQQILANMLTEAGQYMRRERSFEGVEYNTPTVEVAKEIANQVSDGMRQIMEFSDLVKAVTNDIDDDIKGDAGSASEDGSTGGAGAESTSFASVMHNLIGQYLLALKVEPTIKMAIESLKAGEKPVITVANTMESLINELAKDRGVGIGDPVDLGFGDLFVRYLEKTRAITIKDGFGNKQKHYLTDEELGPGGVAMYEAIKQFSLGSDWGNTPISPIDRIKAELERAGYKTGEITGRQGTLDYAGKDPIYRMRGNKERSVAGRIKTIEAFNNGDIDVVILNRAGSTGLSLHASPKTGKDLRRRHMIIAQAEANIDTHMQMLGRVHRTGQVIAPRYSQLVANVPAENRPAAVLAKKMASLNANTSAARSSVVTAKDTLDYMNEYGDEVIANLMYADQELHFKLGAPLKYDDSGNGFEPKDAARKVTGRIPLLPLSDQEALYEQIGIDYKDFLAMKEAMGENKLEAKVFELEAIPTDEIELTARVGDSTSPFAAPSKAIIYDIKRIGKPMTEEERTNAILKSLGNKDSWGWAADNLKAIKSEYEAFEADELATIEGQRTMEATKMRLRYQYNKVVNAIEEFGPSAPFELIDAKGMVFYGEVLGLERKGKAKNPAATGTWKIRLALADSARSITIPLSKITFEDKKEAGKSRLKLSDKRTVDDAFARMQGVSRENRVILEGNLVAAFSTFPGGQIIYFNGNDGHLRQGILMPRNFNLKKAVAKKAEVLRTPDEAVSFLKKDQMKHMLIDDAASGQIGYVRDPRYRTWGWQISVPSSKKSGAKWFLNQDILTALGVDFFKSGSRMVASFDESQLPAVVAAVYKQERLKGVNRSAQESSRPNAVSADMTAKDVRRALDDHFGRGIIQSMINGGILQIVDRIDQLPEHLAKMYKGRTDVDGLYDPYAERGWIIAENSTPDTVAKTLIHEIGEHYGLERMLGPDEYTRILNTVRSMHVAGNPVVKAAWKEVKDYYTREEGSREFLREVLAKVAERAADKPIGVLERIYRAVKKWLADNGWTQLNDRDLQALVMASLRKSTSDVRTLVIRGGEVVASSRSIRDRLAWDQQNEDKNGPVFEAPDFKIISTRELSTTDDFQRDGLAFGHAAHVRAGNKAYRMEILTNDGRRIGGMDAEVNAFGEISAIHDIEFNRYERGKGWGKKVVSYIVANNYDEDAVRIVQIVEDAKAFWRKMGALEGDPYGNSQIAWADHEKSAHRGKGGTLGSDGGGRPGVRGPSESIRGGRGVSQQAVPATRQGGPSDKFLQAVGGRALAKRITLPTYNYAAAVLDRFTPETVKAGVVSDYGLDEAYTDRRDDVEIAVTKHLRSAKTMIERLAGLTRAESRVAYQWLNEKPDTELERQLYAELPEASRRVLDEVKEFIDTLSQEAIELGQLTTEAYERNKYAYLHRSYAKYTLDNGKTMRALHALRRRIIGDQYKGRGLKFLVGMDKLMAAGKRVKQGDKFIRLEKKASTGKITKRIWWKEGVPIPEAYAAFEVDPNPWEWRWTDKKGPVLWRDFSKEEREQMGELDEARFAIVTTISKMAHDIEIGKFFAFVDENYAEENPPPGAEVMKAVDIERGKINWIDALKKGTWVQVPDTKIQGTSVHKYGAIAGKYVPGPIWNDIRQIANKPGVWAWYDKMMKYWKISKTALSPAVHLNNVMANFVMADMHDVGVREIYEAVTIMVKAKKGNADAKAMIERFEDSGAIAGSFIHADLKDDLINPLLEELREQMNGDDEMAGMASIGTVFSLLHEKQWKQATNALLSTKGAARGKKVVDLMMKAYSGEDEIFRLAAFLKGTKDGMTDREAGKMARKSFLDYRINAPWIQNLRHTVLPFVAFSYRMLPMYLEMFAKKPWKLAKYAIFSNAMVAIGMSLAGVDEDDMDEIEKLLPEDKQGITPFLTNRLIPLGRGEDDRMIMLDITRWIPLGDIFEMRGDTSNTMPFLAPAYPSGPMMTLLEVFANKSLFSGRDIWMETDATAEAASKSFAHIWKGWMPNFPMLPGTYSTDKIMAAYTGATDTFGREYDLGQALLSSVGVKAGYYSTDTLRMNAYYDYDSSMDELVSSYYSLARQYNQNKITEAEYDERAAKIQAKIEELTRKYEEKN
jgi:tRNA G10  N-methylase Trm11